MTVFVDRKEETSQVLDGLRSDGSFVVLGMRKIGKTVLLNEIQRELNDENLCVVRVQSSEKKDFEEVLIAIVEGLRDYYRRCSTIGRAITSFNDLIKKVEALRSCRINQRKRSDRHVTKSVSGGAGSGSSRWPAGIGAEYRTEYDIGEVKKDLMEIRKDLENILDILSQKGITVALLLDEFGIYQWKTRKDPAKQGYDFSHIRPTIDFFKPLIETRRGTLHVVLAASINIMALSPRGLPVTTLKLGPFPDVDDDENEDPGIEMIRALSLQLGTTIEEPMALWIKKKCHGMPYYVERFMIELRKQQINLGTIPGFSDLPRVWENMIEALRNEDLKQIGNYYSKKGVIILEKIAKGITVSGEELKGTYLEMSQLISLRDGKWQFEDPILREAFNPGEKKV